MALVGLPHSIGRKIRRRLSRYSHLALVSRAGSELRVTSSYIHSTTGPTLEDHESLCDSVFPEFTKALIVAPIHGFCELSLGLATPVSPEIS